MRKYNIEKELNKMTKIKVKEKVTYIDCSLFSTPEQAIEFFEQYNTPDYAIDDDYDGYYEGQTYYIYKLIDESDEAFELRKGIAKRHMESENAKIDKREEQELAIYEKVKKRLEKKAK